MTTLLRFVFIGVTFIVSAHGASVACGNLSLADSYLGASCGFRIKEFGEKLGHLDFDNNDEMKEFKRSCAALDDCTRILGHCEPMQDEDTKTAFSLMKSTCALIEFATTQFRSCDKKLDEAKSKRNEDWNPFQTQTDLSQKTDITEVCSNYFGKDNCLKKDVTDACGVNEWEKLKEHLLSLNDRVKKCDFKGIV